MVPNNIVALHLEFDSRIFFRKLILEQGLCVEEN